MNESECVEDHDLSTYAKHAIICPYCKYEFEDCHEFFRIDSDAESTEIDCDECDKKFIAWINLKIEYSTFKLKSEK